MGDIVTLADITTAMNRAHHVGSKGMIQRPSAITTVSAFYYSGWKMTGVPATGSTPTAAETCTPATAGALVVPIVASGVQLRLLAWTFYQSSTTLGLMLYDRLAHSGGLAANVTGAQSTNLPVTLTTAAGQGRCAADGSDVEWFVEVFAAGGATSSVSMTVSYTRQDGTAARTSQTITLAASGWPVGRLYPIFPASGDVSIKSVESININTSSGSAGNLGVVAAKRLTMIQHPSVPPLQGGNNTSFNGGLNDAIRLGMPPINDNACLWDVMLSQSTSSGGRVGEMMVGGV